MMKLKKVCALSLLLCHSMTFTDDTGNIIAAALGTVLAAVGSGLWWKSHQEYNEQQRLLDLQYQEQIKLERAESLKKQIRATLDESESFLSHQSQYVSLELPTGSSVEKELESHIVKLGKNLKLMNVHNSIQSDISADLDKFTSLKTKLQDIASCNSDECAQVRSQVALYHANAQKLSSIFDTHSKFFKGHSILNFYESLPIKDDKDTVIEWVYSKSEDKLYPLASYKNQTESDVQFIGALQPIDLVMYPNLAAKLVNEVKPKIEKSVALMYKTGKLQAEMQTKFDNELAALRTRTMQEEALARTRAIEAEALSKSTIAEAQRRNAHAQEDIAREKRIENENKDREIKALRESTRVKEQRIPLDYALVASQQERNRLETKKIEEDRRRTVAIESENKLKADLKRIENQRLEELRRANGGLENINRGLARKNDELEREKDGCKKLAATLKRSLDECKKTCADGQKQIPLAPSGSGSSVPSIGSATLRPGQQPPYNPNYRP